MIPWMTLITRNYPRGINSESMSSIALIAKAVSKSHREESRIVNFFIFDRIYECDIIFA